MRPPFLDYITCVHFTQQGKPSKHLNLGRNPTFPYEFEKWECVCRWMILKDNKERFTRKFPGMMICPNPFV
ncbi:hypothetical protein LguiA_007511 [Lonicera macranthoides]